MPVFIIGTYNADGTPNAMNAAWGGISEETEITICVDSGHKTAENLVTRKAFTVSMATANYVAACDYVGLVSGNKEPDKFAKAGFHATKSEFVDAPLIDAMDWTLSDNIVNALKGCRFETEAMISALQGACLPADVCDDLCNLIKKQVL